MRCFLVKIDPNLIAGTNTEAYVYAPNAATAKQWAEKRWHVDAGLLQTEAKTKSDVPSDKKIVTVNLEGVAEPPQAKGPGIKKARSPFPTRIAGEPLRIPKAGS